MRWLGGAVLVVVVGLTEAVWAEPGKVAGEKKGGIKGRYLTVVDGVDLGAYRGALVILEPAEITADKDRPVDVEAVRTLSDEILEEKLKATALFGRFVSEAPLELPADQPILRLATRLTLQFGSQAMRAFVGAGAGKSKLHIRVDLVDARSGETLASFNGYGTGAGLWSISGGGIQRMSRDDLKESYVKLAELVAAEMR
jgi:hypothetical protein